MTTPRPEWQHRAGRIAGLATVGLLVAGCIATPATEQARAVAELWSQFMVAAAAVAILVWGLITVAVVRFRRRPSDAGTIPDQIRDAPRLEVAWTVGPVLLVLVLFWLTLGALDRIDAHVPSRVTVDVTAFRWQWRFDYPGTSVSVVGGPDTTPEMVVPVGEPVHIVLTSADVDHSFYVPAFLFKRDAIPGRPNEFDVTITDPGNYRGQCAELCGVFHDRMTLTVHAVTRPEFDAWLAAQSAAARSAAP